MFSLRKQLEGRGDKRRLSSSEKGLNFQSVLTSKSGFCGSLWVAAWWKIQHIQTLNDRHPKVFKQAPRKVLYSITKIFLFFNLKCFYFEWEEQRPEIIVVVTVVTLKQVTPACSQRAILVMQGWDLKRHSGISAVEKVFLIIRGKVGLPGLRRVICEQLPARVIEGFKSIKNIPLVVADGFLFNEQEVSVWLLCWFWSFALGDTFNNAWCLKVFQNVLCSWLMVFWLLLVLVGLFLIFFELWG